ncbi:hypothetical protein GQ457_01G040290 [Hibiscus cannabinus]
MGTHIARHVRTPSLSLVLLCLLQSVFITTSDDADVENLLMFKDSLANPSNLRNWNSSVPPCQGNRANWMGLLCVRSQIWGLQLENMGLGGVVNLDILGQIPTLRIVSLMNNDFQGNIPEMDKSGELRALFLSNNRFSGDIPDNAFRGTRSLKNLFLSNNDFTGKIPSSLAKLPKLSVLDLG